MCLSRKFACVLTATLAFAIAAGAKPKLDEIHRAFVGKTYTLKSTCPKSVLNFNAAGEITDDCKLGSWALYSAFHIDGISWSENNLTVSGTRLIGTAVAKDAAVKLEIPDPYRLVLNFQLAGPLTDVPSVYAVIVRDFESQEEGDQELAPYRAFFPPGPMPTHKRSAKDVQSSCREDKTKPVGMLGPDRPVYSTLTECSEVRFENPKAIKYRDPAFTDAARKAHVSGEDALQIVVNERGQPEILKVARRLGYGLDESAVSQVAAWEFNPAKLAGKPIAVTLWVEMSFQLR